MMVACGFNHTSHDDGVISSDWLLGRKIFLQYLTKSEISVKSRPKFICISSLAMMMFKADLHLFKLCNADVLMFFPSRVYVST